MHLQGLQMFCCSLLRTAQVQAGLLGSPKHLISSLGIINTVLHHAVEIKHT